MIPLTPQLLIATASAFVGRREHPDEQIHGDASNRDVALIHHWGFWSHFDHRMQVSSWPIAAVQSAADLGALGSAQGLLREQPEIGDIFLRHAPKRDCFVHAGIVAVVSVRGLLASKRSYVEVVAIEGDSDEGGRFGGGKTVSLTRRLLPSAGDRFLRWADLEGYHTAVERRPASRAEIIPHGDRS